ncbi:MAG: M28 family peptidase [Acidobacteriota bacterium]
MARRISRQSVIAMVAGFVTLGVAAGQSAAQSKPAPKLQISKPMQAAMDHISPDSLRTSVQYLASDELQGRSTPSAGLDLAADFIAAQFKKAGLEPTSGDSYFQVASLADLGTTGQRIERGLPPDAPKTMRNVAGLLRGSDPKLCDTYIIVSAHYDHMGLATSGSDRIFNGANDDASGTASVIELATSLASLKPHPKRSILFITFFGEERGLLGSRFYGAHPIVPIAQTIAQVNLEQVGRSDGADGIHQHVANFTGFDFSDIPAIFVSSAAAAGVQIVKDPAASDAFFGRSDNQALADLGIPAHTLSVLYDFADYHKVSDEWNKLDYPNMAAIDKAVALGLLRLASEEAPPHWNTAYPAAARYAEAAKKLKQ